MTKLKDLKKRPEALGEYLRIFPAISHFVFRKSELFLIKSALALITTPKTLCHDLKTSDNGQVKTQRIDNKRSAVVESVSSPKKEILFFSKLAPQHPKSWSKKLMI
nr:hypothetical protein BHI3_35920 [Bacteriovorax sp. HI3]